MHWKFHDYLNYRDICSILLIFFSALQPLSVIQFLFSTLAGYFVFTPTTHYRDSSLSWYSFLLCNFPFLWILKCNTVRNTILDSSCYNSALLPFKERPTFEALLSLINHNNWISWILFPTKSVTFLFALYAFVGI